MLWDCWGGAATLMDIDSHQHCIHLTSLGSGWQEVTGGSLVRNKTALLTPVSILHVLVGVSEIWVLDRQWFASVDFAHIKSTVCSTA